MRVFHDETGYKTASSGKPSLDLASMEATSVFSECPVNISAASLLREQQSNLCAVPCQHPRPLRQESVWSLLWYSQTLGVDVFNTHSVQQVTLIKWIVKQLLWSSVVQRKEALEDETIWVPI